MGVSINSLKFNGGFNGLLKAQREAAAPGVCGVAAAEPGPAREHEHGRRRVGAHALLV
jgi:hypothetical protein